ncbi:hypothetical protein LshimejAT787_2100030 [Lyophyllum shimeji]|uniref:Uncharacterized protein n=1 Tax=Lyophyllum shimeji TaxID=47721 RepID=A0A9P3Q171_LYOSH|nr:hypothetical protein LshimejAT787_2100030 [Lyophyllum shimeji]
MLATTLGKHGRQRKPVSGKVTSPNVTSCLNIQSTRQRLHSFVFAFAAEACTAAQLNTLLSPFLVKVRVNRSAQTETSQEGFCIDDLHLRSQVKEEYFKSSRQPHRGLTPTHCQSPRRQPRVQRICCLISPFHLGIATPLHTNRAMRSRVAAFQEPALQPDGREKAPICGLDRSIVINPIRFQLTVGVMTLAEEPAAVAEENEIDTADIPTSMSTANPGGAPNASPASGPPPPSQ